MMQGSQIFTAKTTTNNWSARSKASERANLGHPHTHHYIFDSESESESESVGVCFLPIAMAFFLTLLLACFFFYCCCCYYVREESMSTCACGHGKEVFLSTGMRESEGDGLYGVITSAFPTHQHEYTHPIVSFPSCCFVLEGHLVRPMVQSQILGTVG